MVVAARTMESAPLRFFFRYQCWIPAFAGMTSWYCSPTLLVVSYLAVIPAQAGTHGGCSANHEQRVATLSFSETSAGSPPSRG